MLSGRESPAVPCVVPDFPLNNAASAPTLRTRMPPANRIFSF